MLRILTFFLSALVGTHALIAPSASELVVPTACPGSFVKCHIPCMHAVNRQGCIDTCVADYCHTLRPIPTRPVIPMCPPEYRTCRIHCWHQPDVEQCVQDCAKEFCPNLPTRPPHNIHLQIQVPVCHGGKNCIA